MWQYTVEPRFLDKTGAVWRQYINIIHVDVVDSQVFKKVKKGHIPAIKTKSKGIEWKSLIFKWQRRREKRKPSSQKSHPSHPNNQEQSLSLSLSLSLIDPSSLFCGSLSLALALPLARCVPGFSIVRFSHNLIPLQIRFLLLDPQTVSPFFL